TITAPEVARSRPATIINREVLPEPLGPTMATASAAPMLSATSFRIATGPARLGNVRLTLLRLIRFLATIGRAPLARACLEPEEFLRQSQHEWDQAMRTMPSNGRLLNMVLRVLLCNCLLAVLAVGAEAVPARPIRIVVLGDSLVAGFQLKA